VSRPIESARAGVFALLVDGSGDKQVTADVLHGGGIAREISGVHVTKINRSESMLQHVLKAGFSCRFLLRVV
jgi:hypothetical protein